MQYEIKHRWTGAVLFTAELGAEYEAKSDGVTLGAAIKLAFRARADLTGANLAGANLTGANLTGANLARAYLADAYLAGANLAGANLAGAYLARADLARANLARADLAGAYLARADLARAVDVIDAGTPNGWRAIGWRRNGVLRVRVGCRDFTVAEGREYWRGESERREVMAALDYIEAVARLRGWPEAGETKQAA